VRARNGDAGRRIAVRLKGRTALVTGASSGMGACFAKQLAARGADLVITARREDRLKALAAEVVKKHGVAVTVLPLDMACPGAPAELFARTEGEGRPVEVLVNNAGFANLGTFLDVPYERSAELLTVNMLALTGMTWLFGRAMRTRKGGYILNMASFSAFTPVPNMATYSASKVFVRNFSEALSMELEGSGVSVCTICPGIVDTDFYEIASRTASGLIKPSGGDTPDTIAAIGLDALFAGRRRSLPVAKDHVNAFLMRLMPRGFVMKMAGKAMGLQKAGGKD
jgi:uncharacterized protein